MRNNILVLALVAALLGTGVMVTSCNNDPVDLASATDAATFQRGIFSNSRTSGSTPAVVANARGGTSVPFQAQAAGTVVASIDKTGALAVASGSVSADEVANVVRYVPLPLYSFIECQTDAGAAIGFDTTADALPDFVNSATDGTGFVLRFDDTGSSEDQGTEVCTQLTVPGDYASGGAMILRALKDSHTATNTELLTCGASINGAALGVAATTAVTAAATAAYTCTPAGTFAAGDSVSLYLSITSGGTMDDIVDIASAVFAYTATQ